MTEEQRTPDEIRDEIEDTREQLADTAAALAQKADVKGRARDRVDEIKADVSGRVEEIKDKVPDSPEAVRAAAAAAPQRIERNPIPAFVAAAVVGLAIGYFIASRRS